MVLTVSPRFISRLLLRAKYDWIAMSASHSVSKGLNSLVFVYGTLKRNEPNHNLIAEKIGSDAEFVGEAVTKDEYPLVIASKYNIPFLLDRMGLGHKVHGEVYKVSPSLLEILDELENHPDYYKRRFTPIALRDGQELNDCWVYLLPNFRESLLQLEFLESYSSKGAHGKEYVARYNRNIIDYKPSDDVHGKNE